MNKTPETNDLARGNHVVPTEWAEQLERERDEWAAMCGRYKQERDEAMEQNAKLKMEIEDTERAFIATENSWKKLIKENAKLRDIAERAINFGEYRAPYLGYPGPTWEKLRSKLDQLK